MIIRKFLQWTATAPADARADGAEALARAYVDGEFDAAERRDAEGVMTALLDDPSPLVRRAMASVLAPSPNTPHSLATALVADRSDIAALVLAASPVLTSAELVDAAAVGDAVAQVAIAQRPSVEVGLCAALAEVAALPACIALCDNPGAAVPESALARMIARFGSSGALREAIGRRRDLSPGLRYELVAETANSLKTFVTTCGWLSADRAARTVREAADQACMTIAADALQEGGAAPVAQMVRHLRDTGCLTPALILRAALCGNAALFETALSELSGLPLARVSGLVAHGAGLGFTSLYGKAGLPPALRPAFEAALKQAKGAAASDGVTLQRARIGHVLSVCGEARRGGEMSALAALMHRFDAEAARIEARRFARDLMQEQSVLRLTRLAPEVRLQDAA